MSQGPLTAELVILPTEFHCRVLNPVCLFPLNIHADRRLSNLLVLIKTYKGKLKPMKESV